MSERVEFLLCDGPRGGELVKLPDDGRPRWYLPAPRPRIQMVTEDVEPNWDEPKVLIYERRYRGSLVLHYEGESA